jgi:hypothetical protein
MEPQKSGGDDDEEARRRETVCILCIVRVDMAQDWARGWK